MLHQKLRIKKVAISRRINLKILLKRRDVNAIAKLHYNSYLIRGNVHYFIFIVFKLFARFVTGLYFRILRLAYTMAQTIELWYSNLTPLLTSAIEL